MRPGRRRTVLFAAALLAVSIALAAAAAVRAAAGAGADTGADRAGADTAGADAAGAAAAPLRDWSAAERAVLRSLAIRGDEVPPPDPSNAVADDPRAAALGRELFFDARLSADGEVACASCHRPARAFADDRARSRGLGETRRNAPSLLGAAWQQWFYWDGRRDSQWAQALVPIEHPAEQGMDRAAAVALIARDAGYRESWSAIFGEAPPGPGAPAVAVDAAFARLGKVIAAYERTLVPAPSRFDRFVAALLAGAADGGGHLDADERAGLRLFIGERAQCTRCHNGSMLSNGGFHNIGLVRRGDSPLDLGRAGALAEVRGDPFNCLGPFSDADEAQCAELAYMKITGAELPGAFRVPTLRNVARTAPYMHDGRFATLEAVLAHYVAAPTRVLGHQELEPLALDGEEIRQLAAFLRALDGVESSADVAAGATAGGAPAVRDVAATRAVSRPGQAGGI